MTRPIPDPIAVRRQNDLFDLYSQWPSDDPDDDPEFVAAAREVVGLPPLDPDDDARRSYLDDIPDDEIARAYSADAHELLQYWTVGKGLKRWRARTHPFETLVRLLRKHPGITDAEGLAATYYHIVFGFWPGSHKGKTDKPAAKKTTRKRT